MRSKPALGLSALLLSCLFLGCSESPTDLENTRDLITRAWRGETFFTITVDDSSFVARDLVLRLEFMADGNYYLSRASNSSGGRVGRWNLEDNGRQVKFSIDTTYAEVFPIVVLTTTRLVLGDTTSRGYSLVPR
jgi:hypothetical protein